GRRPCRQGPIATRRRRGCVRRLAHSTPSGSPRETTQYVTVTICPWVGLSRKLLHHTYFRLFNALSQGTTRRRATVPHGRSQRAPLAQPTAPLADLSRDAMLPPRPKSIRTARRFTRWGEARPTTALLATAVVQFALDRGHAGAQTGPSATAPSSWPTPIMTASNFFAIDLVGRDVRRVVDDKEDQIVGADVGDAVFLLRGDLDEGTPLGVPALIADLHAGGAGQEVERVVVIVVMR